MTDLVDRLRGWAVSVHAIPASDLMDEAADEIERLRQVSLRKEPAVALLLDRIDSSQRTLIFEQEAEIARLRLTDAEREAIEGAIASEHGRGAWQWAATLRGLLERLSSPAT